MRCRWGRPPTAGAAVLASLLLLASASCSATPTAAPARDATGAQAVATGRATGPAVDTAATPRGWLPVAYGDAQLSVPADWGLVSDGESTCLDAAGAVILGNGSWCPPGVAEPGPPSPMTVSLNSVGAQSTAEDGPPSRVIRGIPLYAPGVAAVYAVPALHAVVDLDGPVPPGVLSSLTYSPRAVVLAPGPRPAVPRSWRWLRFEGLRFAVPPTWIVHRVASPQGCVLPPPVSDQVTLATGPPLPISCHAALPDLRAAQPVAAMELDRVDQGWATAGAVRQPPCPGLRRTGGLRVCVDTTALGSTLDAEVLGPYATVTVLLGLWGDGVTARTMFDSFSMVH